MSINDVNKKPGIFPLGPLPGEAPVAAFSDTAHESLIETKGFLAFHLKHAVDYDRHSEASGLSVDGQGKERPFKYYSCRPLIIVPQNFNQDQAIQVNAMIASGSVMANVGSRYRDGDRGRVFLSKNDLIVMNPSFTVLYRQTFEHMGGAGPRLDYRVQGQVDYMASRSGEYFQDEDFSVDPDTGTVSWLQGGRQPKDKEVVSIVYHRSPIYVVDVVPHFLRVIPANSGGSGALPRQAIYAPQLAVLSESQVRIDEWALDPFDLEPVREYRRYLPTT